MSGNIWQFSDQIDDADIAMLQKDFITYYEGADYYGLGLKIFTRMAQQRSRLNGCRQLITFVTVQKKSF